VGVLRRRWFQILVSGLVLLYLVERTLVATSNPNYLPSVILLGAFLVPVTFVSYLYERLPDWDVPLPPLAICFLWGGVLGTVVAGTLEYDVARALGFVPKLLIGLIEESGARGSTHTSSRGIRPSSPPATPTTTKTAQYGSFLTRTFLPEPFLALVGVPE
jgi:hypothetical protein